MNLSHPRLAAQTRRFREFLRVYNEERPHEALGLMVPARFYVPSQRRWSGRLRSPEYASGTTVRRVRTNGEIKWRSGLVYISTALIGEPVGIEQTEEGLELVRYGPIVLGTLNARRHRLDRPAAARTASYALRASGGQPEQKGNCVTHHAG